MLFILKQTLLIAVITLLTIYSTSARAHWFECSFAITDSVNKGKTQSSDLNGVEFVDITGTIKQAGDKFILVAKNKKTYRLNCKADDCIKYLGLLVRVHGILLQGYDNPKYGNQNLPIDQIKPEDIVNVITSVTLEQWDGK